MSAIGTIRKLMNELKMQDLICMPGIVGKALNRRLYLDYASVESAEELEIHLQGKPIEYVVAVAHVLVELNPNYKGGYSELHEKIVQPLIQNEKLNLDFPKGFVF